MQSLGFAFAMLPVLRKLYPDPTERAARIRQHLEYFNTQPYLASFALGATARAELDASEGAPATDISGIKSSLAGPLGALGDGFFWGGVKPMAAALAVAFMLSGLWWAPLFYLLFYNVWHVGARAELLKLGFGSQGVPGIIMSRFNVPRMAQVFKTMTLAVMGCLVGLVPVWMTKFRPDVDLSAFIQAALALCVALALAAILRKGGSPIKLMLALAALSMILVLLGVNP